MGCRSAGERAAIKRVERHFPRFGRRRASGDALEQPVLVRRDVVLDRQWRRARLCRFGRLSYSNMLEDSSDEIRIVDSGATTPPPTTLHTSDLSC